MTPIGHRLLVDGHISDAQLRAALDRQQREGGRIGHHLIDGGCVSRLDFYGSLAAQWGLELRDLAVRPPSPEALAVGNPVETIALGWVACDLNRNGSVVVATSVRPGVDLAVEVHELFPQRRVQFVACTRRDLDRLALELGLLRSAAPAGPAGPLLEHRMGSLARWSRRRTDGGHPSAADDLLPVYTVIVRVFGGESRLRAALAHLRTLDYPLARLDIVLLVAEGDQATRGAIARVAPPERVRVAVVPDAQFADHIQAHDLGLLLAQGRYVVAYRPRQRPAPDELRRAVAAFESDLADRLDRRRDLPPLGGLRSQRWGSLMRGDEPATSVHCNGPLLRRMGGFAALMG